MKSIPSAWLLATALLAPLVAQDSRPGLEQRLAADPGSARLWRRLQARPDRNDSMEVAERVLRRHPAARRGWDVLARLATDAGDYPTAVRAWERSVRLCTAHEDWKRVYKACAQLHRLHRSVGAMDAARDALVRYRDARRKAGKDTQLADRMLRDTARERALAHLPEYERYEKLAADARGRRDTGFERDTLLHLRYLAFASRDPQRLRKGLLASRRILELDAALDLGPARRADDFNGCGRLALELALRTTDARRRASLLEEARRRAEQAFAGHQELPDPPPGELLRDHCLLAHVHEALGDMRAAHLHFDAELRLVLANRANVAAGRARGDPTEHALRTFDGSVHHIYGDHGLFLARAKQPDLPEALRVTELGRTGSLRELYRLRGRPAPAWMERSLTVEKLVRHAGRTRSAVLAYLVGSHAVGVVTITGRGAAFTDLGARDAVDQAVRTLARVVCDPGSARADVARAGEGAFRALVGDALGTLGDARRLVFVGLGRFGLVPLPALVTPGSGPLEQRYLGARFELARAPTLGSLAGNPGAPAGGPALALGLARHAGRDAGLARTFRSADLPDLQRAEHEARQVALLLGGRALLGAAATERAFAARAPTAGVVHVASHAVVDPDNGARSCLLLAPEADRASDGFLTLSEVLGLRLGARLVILSACSSARGQDIPGEGVQGLARCFLVAGARNVLASVGPVSDQAAPLFIETLCKALAAKRAVTAAVLAARRALLARRVTAHPSLWATFSLHAQDAALLGFE